MPLRTSLPPELCVFHFRTPSEHASGPSNPADLQDFFNRMFKGRPPNDMSANGSFFPTGPPPHHPPGAGANPFSPPPGQTGFYMPGSQRPDSSESWAESGKPPRRRKKVRKPFQRWNLFTSCRHSIACGGWYSKHRAILVSRLPVGCQDLRGFVSLRSQICQNRETEEEPFEWIGVFKAEEVAVMVLYLFISP